MRVISSPSNSTMGFLTLIFLKEDVLAILYACPANAGTYCCCSWDDRGVRIEGAEDAGRKVTAADRPARANEVVRRLRDKQVRDAFMMTEERGRSSSRRRS
jgi:hypothetical protein